MKLLEGRTLSWVLLLALMVGFGLTTAYLVNNPPERAVQATVEPSEETVTLTRSEFDHLLTINLLGGQSGALNEWYGTSLQPIIDKYIPDDKRVDFDREIQALNDKTELVHATLKFSLAQALMQSGYTMEDAMAIVDEAMMAYTEAVDIAAMAIADGEEFLNDDDEGGYHEDQDYPQPSSVICSPCHSGGDATPLDGLTGA